ncbi:MAG: tRNA-dihydrouridine synthase family protein [Muribaculaceae bacterium]|jgi:tRNA-dihydrouridine synthase B|nr:tRNA-dihydrouridine synthase family protein [Muribaculaceae bacterium]
MTNIPLYMAPLQGYTDAAWRNAHHAVFGGVTMYYSPFIRLESGDCRRRDIADISADRNTAPLTPQLLGCKAEDAKKIAERIVELGFKAIDINLGCPFPPIARHHKGSGLLCYPEEVEAMLIALSGIKGITYSVKMRIGYEKPDDWKRIMPLFSIINPDHITIHPRIGTQQYKGELLMDQFKEIYDSAPYPLIFNGDVMNSEAIAKISAEFPRLKGIMLGRGILCNPALSAPEKATSENFSKFHELIYSDYQARLQGGDSQLLTKMKSMWDYFLIDADHKLHKKILKANKLNDYLSAVENLFSSME